MTFDWYLFLIVSRYAKNRRSCGVNFESHVAKKIAKLRYFKNYQEPAIILLVVIQKDSVIGCAMFVVMLRDAD